MKRRIAYVEDDDIIRDNYTEILRDEGFDVEPYATKPEAMRAFEQSLPDLALLDVSLHGERDAGYQICMELRRMTSDLPIIFLTSHDGEVDRISGLRMGADDYLTKDASIDYIVVRIETLFRRLDAIKAASVKKKPEPATLSSVELDDTYSRASWNGHPIELPLTLYWILKDLVINPGQVRTHRELMRAANIVVEQNTITAHVKAIRGAFREIDENFDSIRTERGARLSMGRLTTSHLFATASRGSTSSDEYWASSLHSRRKLLLATTIAILAYLLTLAYAISVNTPFIDSKAGPPWQLPFEPLTWTLAFFAIANSIAILAAATLYFSVRVRFTHTMIAFAVFLAGSTHSMLLPWALPGSEVFFVHGLIHTLVFGHVFNLLPVRYLIVVSTLLSGSFSFVALSGYGPWPRNEALFNIQLLLSVNGILLAAAYLNGRHSRLNHELLSAVGQAEFLRESQSRQRSEWLAFTAHFLRHELRNALIGISSSILLMRRKSTDSEVTTVLRRSEQSAGRMRLLLEEGGAATVAESQFQDPEFEVFALFDAFEEAAEEVFAEIPTHWSVTGFREAKVEASRSLFVEGIGRSMLYLRRLGFDTFPIDIDFGVTSDRATLELRYCDPNNSGTLLEPRFDKQRARPVSAL